MKQQRPNWSQNETTLFEDGMSYVYGTIILFIVLICMSAIDNYMHSYTVYTWAKPKDPEVIAELTKEAQFMADDIVDNITDDSVLKHFALYRDFQKLRKQRDLIKQTCDWKKNDAILVKFRQKVKSAKIPDQLWFTYQCLRTCDSLEVIIAITLDYSPKVLNFEVNKNGVSLYDLDRLD